MRTSNEQRTGVAFERRCLFVVTATTRLSAADAALLAAAVAAAARAVLATRFNARDVEQ